jgi:hypothetical protein
MMTRELQLLLHCARSQLKAGAIKDLVNAGPNWHALLQLGEHHGVRPMLRKSLKLVCWDGVPDAIQLELENFVQKNLQKNLFLMAELLRLLGLFRQNGIPIAAFKGPILAELVYGDLSLREFADLDVIVHQADLRKAENVLNGCGYVAQFPDADYRSTFLSYHGQYVFCHTQTGFCVDLHWQLSSKGVAFPVQSADVWSKLQQATIADRTVLTLANDDLMLFLAAHGTKEGWRRLVWVSDFAELLRKCQDIDWADIFDRARRSHSLRSLLLAINLASTLLDAPTPANVIETARVDSAVRVLSEKALFRMLHTAPLGELHEFLDSLHTHDRLRHRLWPIATLLTTRTVGDYQAMPLPKPFWGIYYLTRPFRLAGKAVEMMLGKS